MDSYCKKSSGKYMERNATIFHQKFIVIVLIWIHFCKFVVETIKQDCQPQVQYIFTITGSVCAWKIVYQIIQVCLYKQTFLKKLVPNLSSEENEIGGIKHFGCFIAKYFVKCLFFSFTQEANLTKLFENLKHNKKCSPFINFDSTR